jgi:hypothetical protein
MNICSVCFKLKTIESPIEFYLNHSFHFSFILLCSQFVLFTKSIKCVWLPNLQEIYKLYRLRLYFCNILFSFDNFYNFFHFFFNNNLRFRTFSLNSPPILAFYDKYFKLTHYYWYSVPT